MGVMMVWPLDVVVVWPFDVVVVVKPFGLPRTFTGVCLAADKWLLLRFLPESG